MTRRARRRVRKFPTNREIIEAFFLVRPMQKFASGNAISILVGLAPDLESARQKVGGGIYSKMVHDGFLQYDRGQYWYDPSKDPKATQPPVKIFVFVEDEPRLKLSRRTVTEVYAA